MTSERTKEIIGSFILFIFSAFFAAIFGSIFLGVIGFIGIELGMQVSPVIFFIIASICFLLGFLLVRKIMHSIKKEISEEKYTKEYYSFRWMPISPFILLFTLMLFIVWRYDIHDFVRFSWTLVIVLSITTSLVSYKKVTFQTEGIEVKSLLREKLILYKDIVFVEYSLARFRRGSIWDIFLFHLKNNKKEEKIIMMTLSKNQREIFIKKLKENIKINKIEAGFFRKIKLLYF